MTQSAATQSPHICLIAGEVSGDMLGADLVASLKARFPGARFSGVGGEHMSKQGLKSYFPMEDIALMGFAEIIPHLFTIKKRMKQTIQAIREQQPDILITIDSPGFTFRIVKALTDIDCPKIHYVAPTVWAYKPERAAKTAALFDHLLTLLPFEPLYFEKEGLKTDFIGHPTIWRHRALTLSTGQNDLTLALLPGSRRGELKKHLPVFKETVAKLVQNIPNLKCVMPLPDHLAADVEALVKSWALPIEIVAGEAKKMEALSSASAALAKSGTVSLELACAHLPTVTMYRANPISAYLIRRMIKSNYVNLVNIVADKLVIPEYLQEDCNAENLAQAVLPLLMSEEKRNEQIQEFDVVLEQLGRSAAQSPSDKAAEIIGSYLS